jgi:hypothetical protein
MIVAPGTVGEAMTTWLESRKTKTLAFELSDQSFRPNSAAPARITVTRANQVAAVVSESPTLKVHILEPAHLRSAAAERLDQQRAHRLRDELLARGVEGSRVTIGRQQKEPSGPDSPHVIVVLSK